MDILLDPYYRLLDIGDLGTDAQDSGVLLLTGLIGDLLSITLDGFLVTKHLFKVVLEFGTRIKEGCSESIYEILVELLCMSGRIYKRDLLLRNRKQRAVNVSIAVYSWTKTT